jgi:hypothetical protein
MEGGAMKDLSLRLQLALRRADPLLVGAALLLAAVLAAFGWTLHARQQVQQERVRFEAQPARRAAAPGIEAAAAPAPDRLAAFNGALGERAQAEQQLRTLFALAARHGLELRQGEYKPAWDRNAQLYTYQVDLPVKGSYEAVWQFALAALRAIPFAALDDISFRRDGVRDAAVEARLRLTLYLRDTQGETP